MKLRPGRAPTDAGALDHLVAFQLIRDVLSRARTLDLTARQWKVLSIVIDLTLTYSKPADRVYLGVVASQLYAVEVSSPRQRERAGRVLGELVDLGLIERELPRPGRPTGSRTGEGRGPDYLIRIAGNPPQAGGVSVPETHPKRAGNPPLQGGPT